MHVISQKKLALAAEKYPQFRDELIAMGKIIAKGYFPGPDSLRQIYPTLDNIKYIDKYYVIDIARNRLRVIAIIFFRTQKFYVRHVYTHKEYDEFVMKCRTKGKTKWL
ncbi:type II toxin-antitoxin system HigB family toxin [Superficieibacter sp. HKU1]|uniref:type II toxin-antitoxin system HigB family toxin n=1 Tax=Superficieibacter sp. HKU1 TaxID=3031919 RepID=UPI0023E29EDC|nr:type II toxin-antitoxin system HigB family toxin [Superficieibacter sp. HKU1]WES70452.1 type II toxin-antitoxin system HigB family toxin [Superficieibacter sp. HKU1]